MGYFDTSILASHTLEEFKSAVNRKHWNLFHTAPIPDEYKSKISYIPNIMPVTTLQLAALV